MNIIRSLIKMLLEAIYNLAGDYGLAIIGVTLTTRLLLLPLNFKQRKSLEKQQITSLKLNEIKEKYKGNPYGIFAITIPSGIGLYWMISGLYTFFEQLIYNLVSLRTTKETGMA